MMKKITDYSEVSPLVMKFYRRGVITNNFMTPKAYKAEICEENLYFFESEDILCLYLKRDGFYIMYFYARHKDARFPEINEKIVSEASGEAAKMLTENGFSEYIKRVHFEKNEDTPPEMSDYKTEDAAGVHKLFSESFNKYSAWLPTASELSESCLQGLCYAINRDGKTVAALESTLSGKIAVISHIAVLPEYRKNGYARILVKEFLKENKKCAVWTGEDNLPAQELYKSLGFLKSDKKSQVFMKG